MISFRKMVRKEISAFFDSYRSADATDLLYKWIGTFNFCPVIFVRFISWVCFPQLASVDRKKPTATRPVNDFRFAG
jgi:hypothetical protein